MRDHLLMLMMFRHGLRVSGRAQSLSEQAVNHPVAAASDRAGPGRVNPHLLRYSCGLAIANWATTCA